MIGAIAAAVSLELIHGLTGCWRDKHLDDVAELGPQHPGHAVVEAPQWVSLQLQLSRPPDGVAYSCSYRGPPMG